MQYQAYEVSETQPGKFAGKIVTKDTADLPAGEVLIRVQASSLNYKDMLSSRGNRGVTRHYPHVPGIDAAGVVEEYTRAPAQASDQPQANTDQDSASRSPVPPVFDFAPGDQVIVCGFDLGMNTPGGLGQFIRVPAQWVVPMPRGMDPVSAMSYGTAGLTAGLCVHALQRAFVLPDSGPIVVTGAGGGVGSLAIQILSMLGYRVWGVTHSVTKTDWLRELGAAGVLLWDDFNAAPEKPLLSQDWAGGIDTLGGPALERILRSLQFGGAAAACGNALSGSLNLSMYPFILRGISLVGIASADTPLVEKKKIWELLAGDWRVENHKQFSTTISLEEVDSALTAIEQSTHRGRFIVYPY